MNPFILVDADEYDHEPTEDEHFNESVYVNGFDLEHGLGGWMRLGKRANEGHAELQTCFYLPDGRVACQFKRPGIESNEGFDVAGMRYEVIEPHKTIRMSYDGPMMLLDDTDVLRDPRALFGTAPVVDGAIELTLDAVSPIHGGEPLTDEQVTWYPRNFSKSHFFQHGRTVGSVGIADQEFAMEGLGWRDHSWGPRHWSNIHYYRLLICTFADDLAFTILKITGRDGVTHRHGVLLAGDDFEEMTDLDLVTTWSDQKDPLEMLLTFKTESHAAVVQGEVKTLAPLSNKRKVGDTMLRTRIAEGLTVWDWAGQEGLGITEYIERVGPEGPVGWPL